MAAFSLTDATILVHGHDFSADTNQVSLAAEAEALESTTFRSDGWRARVAGLRSVSCDISGFWDPAPDEAGFGDLGVASRVCVVSPTNDEGDVAWIFRAGKFNYSQFGEVGALAPFSLGMVGTNREGLVRGRVIKSRGNVNAVGVVGTAFQVGATDDDPLEHMYGALHVFSAGTTMTAVIESAADNTFVGATTRATLGPITATGGYWATRVAGPITDTWYRIRVTAITGTFDIAGAVGIGRAN
jgi:hypothetical protein